MSRPTDLPSSWLAQFDGAALESKLAVSAIVAASDAEGVPHIAYLSAGEVLAREDGGIALALWPESHVTAGLRHGGRGILHGAADGAVWSVRLEVRAAGPVGRLAGFLATIGDVARHAAPYAEVDALIRFTLADPAATLSRWRDQIALMRDMA